MNLARLAQRIKQNDPVNAGPVKARFVVIIFFIFMALVFLPLFGLRSFLPQILIVCFIGGVANCLSLLWIASGKGIQYRIYYASFVDFLLITIALHYLGGVEESFSWIYAVALMAIASRSGLRIGVYSATISFLMYSTLLVTEFIGVIQHIDYNIINPAYIHVDPYYLYIKLLSGGVLFFISSIVAGFLSEKLLRSRSDMEKTVLERTAQLTDSNDQLRQEVSERKHAEAGLQESLSLQTATLESTADGILAVDKKGNIRSYNQRFVEIWNIPQETLGANDAARVRMHMLNQTKYSERTIQDIENLYTNSNLENFAVLELKDGRVLERHSNPQKIGEQVVGVVISFRDVTERIRVEQALGESEKRHRILAENVKDLIWAMDIDAGRLTYISPSVTAMLGYSVKEAMNLMLDQLLTPSSFQNATSALAGQLAPQRLLQEGAIWSRTIELEYTRKDGFTFWGEATVTFVRGEGGKPVELLGVTRDITDRRKAEEALRKSEDSLRESKKRLSKTLNAVPDMVYELALDGTVLYANETASQTLGIPLEKPGEITLLDFMDEEGVKTATREIQKMVETREPSRNVLYNLKAFDGRIIPIESHAVILERMGQSPTVLGVARDIREKKLLEEQLLQAQKMESIGTLAGGIAHDFNNILGGILGYASFMKSKVESDHPFFKYLDTIERSSTRAAELTTQLLGFARGGKYDTKPLDLNDAVKETLDIIERTVDKSIAIETRMGESLPTIAGDRGQLQQVLMNLFINAADAMPAGGRLTIEADVETLSEEYARLHAGAKSGSYVRLSVTDTGIGMDKETQKRIFEPFFTTKKEGKGTGLGLAMVYGVVKNHGGYITVYSELGHGTTFKIYMPVSGEAERATTPRVMAPHGRGELVLIVDDEEPIREFTKDVLEASGYRVILAEDGVQAVRIFKAHNGDISLVILDMVMPNMGGHEAFIEMRANNSGVRALLSTGYSQNGKAKEILDSGVMGFLQKPYRVNTLLSKVKSVLDTEVKA